MKSACNIDPEQDGAPTVLPGMGMTITSATFNLFFLFSKLKWQLKSPS